MAKKRGAPTKPPDKRKSVIYPIRMTEADREIIDAAGSSAWSRETLLKAALKKANKRKAGESNPSAQTDPSEGL